MEHVKIEGGERLLRLLQRGAGVSEIDVGIGLWREANKIFNASQNEVPVRYGILKASGQVSKPEYVKSKYVQVTIGYGGAAKSYALIVHENLEAHHPHGKAKYLEDPVMRAVPELLNRVADQVEAAMRRLAQ